MHEANIGAQFWSRNDGMSVNLRRQGPVQAPRVTSQDFGAVDRNDRTKAAVLSMHRTLDRHDTLAPGETAGDNTGQGHLFLSQTATDWKVHGLFAHEDMKYTVPALLGLAAIHSLKTSRKVPTATAHLSVHSKRVVDRLVEAKLLRDPLKGMTGKFTPNGITDGAGYAQRQNMGALGDVAIPTSDSDNASNSYRSAMGGVIAKKRAKKAIANRPRPVTPPGWATPGLFEAEPYKVRKPKKAGK